MTATTVNATMPIASFECPVKNANRIAAIANSRMNLYSIHKAIYFLFVSPIYGVSNFRIGLIIKVIFITVRHAYTQ